MMTRYERIIKHLDKYTAHQDIFICNAKLCACKGCVGNGGTEKKITQSEIDMYKSGEMQKIVDKQGGA